jgi:hypothetical protein
MRREPFNSALDGDRFNVAGREEFVFNGLIVDFANSRGIGLQSSSYHLTVSAL